MTYSSSFISGLKWARELAQKLTDFTGVKIFPYSVFYVYYEHYLTIIHDMALNIGVSIGNHVMCCSRVGEYLATGGMHPSSGAVGGWGMFSMMVF